jgi:hypothetical protein
MILTKEHFDEVWVLAALHGQCDEIDGAEYRRVYAEWLYQCSPSSIMAFILRHANLPATWQAPPGQRADLQ